MNELTIIDEATNLPEEYYTTVGVDLAEGKDFTKVLHIGSPLPTGKYFVNKKLAAPEVTARVIASHHFQQSVLWHNTKDLTVVPFEDVICIKWENNKVELEINVVSRILYILKIKIHKNYRGCGFGNKLYQLCEQLAKDLDCVQIRQTPSGWAMIPNKRGVPTRGESREAYLLRRGWLKEGVEVYKDL